MTENPCPSMKIRSSRPIKQSSGSHALLWLSEPQSFNIQFVHSNDNLGPSINELFLIGNWLIDWLIGICFGLRFSLGIDCSHWGSVSIATLSCTWILQDLPPAEDQVIPHAAHLNIKNWLFHLLVFFRELCHSFSEKFDWNHLHTEVPHHCRNKDTPKSCLCFAVTLLTKQARPAYCGAAVFPLSTI